MVLWWTVTLIHQPYLTKQNTLDQTQSWGASTLFLPYIGFSFHFMPQKGDRAMKTTVTFGLWEPKFERESSSEGESHQAYHTLCWFYSQRDIPKQPLCVWQDSLNVTKFHLLLLFLYFAHLHRQTTQNTGCFVCMRSPGAVPRLNN